MKHEDAKDQLNKFPLENMKTTNTDKLTAKEFLELTHPLYVKELEKYRLRSKVCQIMDEYHKHLSHEVKQEDKTATLKNNGRLQRAIGLLDGTILAVASSGISQNSCINTLTEVVKILEAISLPKQVLNVTDEQIKKLLKKHLIIDYNGFDISALVKDLRSISPVAIEPEKQEAIVSEEQLRTKFQDEVIVGSIDNRGLLHLEPKQIFDWFKPYLSPSQSIEPVKEVVGDEIKVGYILDGNFIPSIDNLKYITEDQALIVCFSKRSAEIYRALSPNKEGKTN